MRDSLTVLGWGVIVFSLLCGGAMFFQPVEVNSVLCEVFQVNMIGMPVLIALGLGLCLDGLIVAAVLFGMADGLRLLERIAGDEKER